MEDPVRFSQGDDDTAKRLMLSMREEKPPDGALGRALLAVGVTGAAVVTTGSALGAASPAGKSLVWLAVKWLGSGAVLGLAVGGGATLLSSPPERPADTPVSVAVPLDRPAAPVAPPRNEVPSVVAPREEERPAPRSSVVKDPVPEVPSVAPDTLAREIELLDGARGALRRGAPNEALATLDRFAKEFPRGRLSTEALVVRIDALVRAGRSAEARALGERFLSQNPSSTHAPRIKQLIGL